MMTAAKTLEEIYDNFEGNRPLGEDEYEFFVNIYETKLKRFIGQVKRNKLYQNIFFIAGQRGNGKSSILNNLKHKNRDFEEEYEIRHLQAMDLLDYDDIDIVDILLVIGFDLLDNNQLNELNKGKLQEEFKSNLERLEKLNRGELELSKKNSSGQSVEGKGEVKVSTKVGFFSFFSANSTFSSTYKADLNIRKEAKEIYRFKTKDLLNEVNSLIKTYKRLLNTEKEILLILDGLEKLNDIDDVFTKDVGILRDIECFKIVTMPVYLKEVVDVYSVKAIDFTMEIDENGEIKHLDLLKKVVTNRIENRELISESAIDLAVEKSGGNLRQLLNIIHSASQEAMDITENDCIDVAEVKNAVEVLKGQLASRTQVYSEFLKKINSAHKITSEEQQQKLAACLKAGLVFAYFNGRVYYNVNPIILDNVE